MRKFFFRVLFYWGLLHAGMSFSQVCDPTTPVYTVNLTGSPFGTWISPSDSRQGYCCSSTGVDKCVEFIITLDSAATGINFEIASGAVPPGSLYYQINCGPPVMVGQPICLDSAGPHLLTFCKPGNNPNSYSITSITHPVVDINVTDIASPQCSSSLYMTGLAESTVSWTSVPPNIFYNSFLSCVTNCDSPSVTPSGNFPPYIDYMVCGNAATPCASETICDTTRVHFIADLVVSVSPANINLCNGVSTVNVSAVATGGSGSYQFLWSNGQTTPTITAGAGTYTVTVTDTAVCSTATDSSVIVVRPPIVVNAGSDVLVCSDQPAVNLNGSLQTATAALWTGGSGTFNPNNSVLNAVYTPSAFEISNGQAVLVLESTANLGCSAQYDTVHIAIASMLAPSISGTSLLCAGSTTNYSAALIPGCSYNWSVTGGVINGSAFSNSINVTWNNTNTGLVTLTQTNSSGCDTTDTLQVSFVVLPNPVINGNQTVCQHAPATYSILSLPGSVYSWTATNGIIVGSTSNSTAQMNWNFPGSGMVTVVETNSFGCSQSFTLPVIIPRRPVPNITGNNATCISDSILTYTSPLWAGVGYTWRANGGTIVSANGCNTISVDWSSAGAHTVTLVVTDSTYGCESSAQYPVIVGAVSPPTVQANGLSGCPPLRIEFSGNAPLPGQTYDWTFGDQWYSAAPNPTHVYEEPGIYHLVLQTQHPGGCVDSAVADIEVFAAPLTSFNHNFETTPYMVDESALELANTTQNATSWLWTFGTGDTANAFEPSIKYKIPGDYTIELISFNASGCPDTMLKEIRVRNKEYIYVPSAFTPNGDQVNDYFFIMTTNIKSANISIFNRWGEFLFNSDDKYFRWNGTYQGNEVPIGLYGYVIDAVGESGRPYMLFGTVSVMR